MDRAELDSLRAISRWTIAAYVTAIAITLGFGLDTSFAMLG